MTDPIALPVAPRTIPRPEHNVSRANISRNALKVLYRLKDGGYQAFIVGGGVRDLLLGGQPKDFDIATDASPEQVRALFGNCRLIGRRFRLAHVRFRDEIVEVATFRGIGGEDLEAEDRQVLDEHGRILKDNAFGSLEEDAWRRDFTINALYYDVSDFSILDYVGGMEDIAARRLRLIGDPETRFREDPVRMIRAARLAAKLNLEIEAGTAAPMGRLAPLLDHVPPARLFDEFLKVFETGHALESYQRLQQHGLFAHLFPATAKWLAADPDGRRSRFVEAALANTDRRVAEGLSVTPMFLFGVFLWGPVQAEAARIEAEHDTPAVPALIEAALALTEAQVQRVALPRRFSVPMREMLQLQARFERGQGRRPAQLMQHRRFRAAYDLLALRTELGEVSPELVDWWTAAQQSATAQGGAAESGDAESRDAEHDQGAAPPARRRSGSRRRRGGRNRSRPPAPPA